MIDKRNGGLTYAEVPLVHGLIGGPLEVLELRALGPRGRLALLRRALVRIAAAEKVLD